MPAVAVAAAAAVAMTGLLPATAHAAATPQAAAPAVTPTGNAFYTPPSPLPSGKPGQIIRYRSVSSPALASKAWQVLYLSTTAQGKPTAVSGEVIVPTAPYTGTGTHQRPVVAYAPGTQGWGPQCAPSREMAAGDFDEQFAVDNLLAKGWAVAVTDYPGLGTPGPEIYNVGIAEGHAVLDSLRAALALPGDSLSASAPVAVEGYSQGGGAAGWAAQLHHTYAPSLNLKGVAMGGTPANLQTVANNINGTAFFAFLAGSAIGFAAAYPQVGLSKELTAAGKQAFAQLETMCQVQGLLTYAGKTLQDYTVGGVNPMNDPAWTAVLDENNLGKIAPDVPVLQSHGLLDEVIPYSVEVTLHEQYCSLGVKSQLDSFVGEHVTTALEDQPAVLTWLANRFAGQPAPSNC
jgi:pimeloyl-ACP methyl ester carboxylesterase